MEKNNFDQETLKNLLKEFSYISITDDDKIEEEFIYFEAGTDRFEILKWFDKLLDNGIVKTIYEQKKLFEEIEAEQKPNSKRKRSFNEIRSEMNKLYDQIEKANNRIKKLTKECVDRFAVLDPGNEIYSNSPFQSTDRLAYKIRIKDIKLKRTRDGYWFWIATGTHIKIDGTESSLTKSFSTLKFK